MKNIIYLSTFILLVSCKTQSKEKDKVWNALPEVTTLESLKQTEFVPTLENPVSANKNTIYAPAFLFAWDKLEEVLKSPVIAGSKNSKDFTLVNNSRSHLGSLNPDEYSVNAEVEGGAFFIRAFFNKTLPFETRLQLSDNPILFNKTARVAAFGMSDFDENAIKFTNILYYKDDDHFILQLLPKDVRHEILLAKGLAPFSTLAEATKEVHRLILAGKKESINRQHSWKYHIVEGDIFLIPNIQFNIETNYPTLEQQRFITKDNKNHFIAEAYQRTGFILNESGAVAESEVYLTVDSMPAKPVKKLPKKMMLDRSFLVILKHNNQTNPYFVMNVNNSELLITHR